MGGVVARANVLLRGDDRWRVGNGEHRERAEAVK
jgi:hypothetical protein